jgi:hypothetical protein
MTGTSDLIHLDRPYRYAKLYPAQFSRSCPSRKAEGQAPRTKAAALP